MIGFLLVCSQNHLTMDPYFETRKVARLLEDETVSSSDLRDCGFPLDFLEAKLNRQ